MPTESHATGAWTSASTTEASAVNGAGNICTGGESDKATIEVPSSSSAGLVKEVRIKLGDKVSEGAVLLVVEAGGVAVAAAPTTGGVVEVKVPDIGDVKDVPVIELFVKVGDTIKLEDPICSLESDKATMEVPSPVWSRKCWSSSAARSPKAAC